MGRLGRGWRVAELRQRGGVLAAFVAACCDDEKRARAARDLGARLTAYGPADRWEAEEAVATLERWAGDLEDHPYHPGVPRPDESDRQTRDHFKDVQRDRLTTAARNWRSGTQLSLDVYLGQLSRVRGLAPCVREDVYYLYGRGTMALDLGDRATAARVTARLRELRDAHVR
ncbi:hypothetical protein [Streptomyces sp. KAU_LT]|uniref:hypothetical protein n=1 Tax=unclassified Streptomyces TaxID=2593676 RepID=UPI0024B69EF1|nr:hypothetical protein [Streptomyces sp. KAU_LT]MDI9831918.1 hypothetical protein [Streptomyces sp. KAU_LT]